MERAQKFVIKIGVVSLAAALRDSQEAVDRLEKISPLHKIRPITVFPPCAVIVAERDAIADPAHSYKFVAALQKNQAGTAPIMMFVEKGGSQKGGSAMSTVYKWVFLKKHLCLSEYPENQIKSTEVVAEQKSAE